MNGRKWYAILLGILLILWGILQVFPALNFPLENVVLGFLAIASGLLFLLDR